MTVRTLKRFGLLILAATVAVGGCAGGQRKDSGQATQAASAVHDKLDVPEMGLFSLTLQHTFKVTNPSSVPLSVQGANYTYTFCDKQVFSGQNPAPLSVPASGSANYVITQKIDLPFNYEELKTLLDRKDGAYALSGQLLTDAGALPLSAEGDIALPIMLEVKLEGASISPAGKDVWDLTFDVIISNENPWAEHVSSMDYTITVLDQEVKQDTQIVGERVQTPGIMYVINARVTPDNMPKDKLKQFTTAKTLNYALTGELKLKGFAIPIAKTGSLNFSR